MVVVVGVSQTRTTVVLTGVEAGYAGVGENPRIKVDLIAFHIGHGMIKILFYLSGK